MFDKELMELLMFYEVKLFSKKYHGATGAGGGGGQSDCIARYLVTLLSRVTPVFN